jgi:hypothetical protein
VCIISIFGFDFVIENSYKNICYVSKLKENYQKFKERQNESILPDVLPVEWTNKIAGNSVQILPWELSYAEANHWDAWQPNPVLQLYSGYTKKLDEYSASSFISERAPRFILLEYNTIENRNMFFDTPATWNAISPNYHIVKKDGRRLLLAKNGGYKSINFTSIDTKIYQFNELIEIPESTDPVYAKITIENSIPGKIITTLFRGNPSQIDVKYKNGDEFSYRIIADTLRNPVLIKYVPNSFDQTYKFFNDENKDLFTVKEIKFSNKVRSLYYKKNIKIEWLSAI